MANCVATRWKLKIIWRQRLVYWANSFSFIWVIDPHRSSPFQTLIRAWPHAIKILKGKKSPISTSSVQKGQRKWKWKCHKTIDGVQKMVQSVESKVAGASSSSFWQLNLLIYRKLESCWIISCSNVYDLGLN